ncbi:putative type II secretion system protein [Campylobacter iguaniorum]|uniref:prepilin-type N-terminal cleavage/methylation domain-containing protein n=1 Tax=Campylobacter iguaniorum TaxID=1244531 RepID=UPI00073A0E9E|nr:prepilin-type N-terminal cleavage/methylation domain-containing protein [Campylobacter iguaniorum]ALV24226.1 putative type II secretion system protein [Campylobacter iguaniorum]
MKKAFTLLELVVVIVVIGVLASVAMPRFDRNNLQLAADQILSHIRYTQHLAMVDDKFNPVDANWYKSRWQIYFNTYNGEQTYTIFSDSPTYSGNPDGKEIAKNPLKPDQMLTIGHSGISTINPSPELNLTKKYGITNITLSSGCSVSGSKRITFDELGRPYKGNIKSNSNAYQNAASDCSIKISTKTECINIKVTSRTGYAYTDTAKCTL